MDQAARILDSVPSVRSLLFSDYGEPTRWQTKEIAGEGERILTAGARALERDERVIAEKAALLLRRPRR